MKKFTKLTGRAAPLPVVNVDTDMIIPKQYLKTIKRTGLGRFLFDEMRHNQDGSEKPEFILNQQAYRNAQILVAGANLGCGSSREHAPWAIADFGISCIIAPSYADIFYNNSFKNAILPITLPEDQVNEIMEYAKQPENEISVDLEGQLIQANGKDYAFEIDPFRKYCLLNGLDDIGLTLEKIAYINNYEKKMGQLTPWHWNNLA